MFVTGPGPDVGGSNQGNAGCVQIREKSGIDAAPCVALPGASAMGVAVCARTRVVAAIVNVRDMTAKSTFRCLCMPNPLYGGHHLPGRRDWFNLRYHQLSDKIIRVPVCMEGAGDVSSWLFATNPHPLDRINFTSAFGYSEKRPDDHRLDDSSLTLITASNRAIHTFYS